MYKKRGKKALVAGGKIHYIGCREGRGAPRGRAARQGRISKSVWTLSCPLKRAVLQRRTPSGGGGPTHACICGRARRAVRRFRPVLRGAPADKNLYCWRTEL